MKKENLELQRRLYDRPQLLKRGNLALVSGDTSPLISVVVAPT